MVSRVKAYIALSRVGNGLIAFIGVVLGAHLALKGVGRAWTWGDVVDTAIVAVATVLILAAGNALNDVCDVEIDRVNRPNRPIPSGRVSVRGATRFAFVAITGGLVLAFLVGPAAFGVALAAALLLAFYAIALKATPLLGNLVVGLLSAGAYFAGGIAVDAARYALVPLVFIFLFTVVREIIKDIEDLEGDRRAGARTLPVALGERGALVVATLFALLGVGLTAVPYLLGWAGFGWRYFTVVLLGVDLVVVAVLGMLWRRTSPEVAARAQRWVKASMFAGLFAIVVG